MIAGDYLKNEFEAIERKPKKKTRTRIGRQENDTFPRRYPTLEEKRAIAAAMKDMTKTEFCTISHISSCAYYEFKNRIPQTDRIISKLFAFAKERKK